MWMGVREVFLHAIFLPGLVLRCFRLMAPSNNRHSEAQLGLILIKLFWHKHHSINSSNIAQYIILNKARSCIDILHIWFGWSPISITTTRSNVANLELILRNFSISSKHFHSRAVKIKILRF